MDGLITALVITGLVGFGGLYFMISWIRKRASQETPAEEASKEEDQQEPEELPVKVTQINEAVIDDNSEIDIKHREPRPDELALGWETGQHRKTKRLTMRQQGIKQKDRDTHFYIVGSSGTGKTKFLESLMRQDIKNHIGFGVVDPHGDLFENIKVHLLYHAMLNEQGPIDETTGKEKYVQYLQERVVVIDPTEPTATASFNPLELLPGVSAPELANEMTAIFKKIWGDSWGVRMEDVLRNTFIALAEAKLTLADLPEFLTDDEFRARTLGRVRHPLCIARFRQYDAQTQGSRLTMIEPVLNKVNALLADDRLRHLFMSPKSTFNLREVIDSGKILLVNLNKGRLKGSAELLGALLVSKLQMAAFARTDQTVDQRRQFHLYIDEFQNFATESFIDTLSEARKYRLSLILAHQTLSQLPERLQATILANCGIQAYFKTSRKDAQILAKESLGNLVSSQGLNQEAGVQYLQDLAPREFVVKHKPAGGLMLLRTDEVAMPWQKINPDSGEPLLDGGEAEFKKALTNVWIGRRYLRKRKKVEQATQEERKAGAEDAEPETFEESAEEVEARLANQ